MSMIKTEDVRRFIVEWMANNRGVPPTFREIQEAFAFTSTAPPRHHTEKLEVSGHLATRRRGRFKARQLFVTGAAYGVPRNILEGNLTDVAETSVYIDQDGPYSADLMGYFSKKKGVAAHWLSRPQSATMGFAILHPDQIAIISDKPEHIFMGLAYGTAVYPQRAVWRHITNE